MTAPSADEITREIYIAAPPQAVYVYFTDPVKVLAWKGMDATLDPRPGGVYRLNLGEGNIVLGEYVRLKPYSQIVFTWGWEGVDSPLPPGSSTVEVNFVAERSGTLVRLRHYGLPSAVRQQHAEGWDYFLPRLERAIAEGTATGE
jgi:uncharacterized protein YndB with AHSA1/START domain